MANVSFDNTDLSSLGFSLHSVVSRGIAPWKSELVEIPGTQKVADISTRFQGSQTQLVGMLSADTALWSNYTHAKLLERLQSLKGLIDPRAGFKKLVITGDQPTRFRWARGADQDWTELRPVFKLPHQALSLTFDNLEPYWREVAADVVRTGAGAVANVGQADTQPVIDLAIGGTIAATQGAIITPVTLMVLDDFSLNWIGLGASGTLHSGDKLSVDCESMTVTWQVGGTGPWVDAIRYYDYGGAGAVASGGFPVVKKGGSSVVSLHASVTSATFHYDSLYL